MQHYTTGSPRIELFSFLLGLSGLHPRVESFEFVQCISMLMQRFHELQACPLYGSMCIWVSDAICTNSRSAKLKGLAGLAFPVS